MEVKRVKSDGTIGIFKPSIYGWGQLEHPVKPTPEKPKKKKKKKWVDPTINMSPPPSQDHPKSGIENGAGTRRVKFTPVPSTVPKLTNPRQEGDSNQKPSTGFIRQSFPVTGPRKNISKRTSENDKTDSTIPAPMTRLSSKGTGRPYYGQFRCGNCLRYWRSGLARDGVFQSCAKCGTPTYPSKNDERVFIKKKD